MGQPLNSLTIRGFKSIECLEDFKLQRLNILIGANGAGKSNFVEYFRMLRAFADETFQQYVIGSGGGDGLLFLGPKVTPQISSRVEFGNNAYDFTLKPTAQGSLQFIEEHAGFSDNMRDSSYRLSFGSLESGLKLNKDGENSWNSGSANVANDVYSSISSWIVYHFHDTSSLAPMRRDQSSRDWERFRQDASNIAPFLLNLKQKKPASYELIRDTVRLIAPFFDDFLLRTQTKGTEESVRLEWRQKGSDFPFQPYHLSDGTIRFICLTIALLQPDLPATIVIDEPEIGLHPYAVSMLADLIKSASERTQVIISTQASALLDYFNPQEIIVVNRRKGHSTFERLDAENLTEWMKDYSVGELWQKNVVQGGPASE